MVKLRFACAVSTAGPCRDQRQGRHGQTRTRMVKLRFARAVSTAGLCREQRQGRHGQTAIRRCCEHSKAVP